MISTIQVLDAGNALRLFVQPPTGATRVRLLRKTANDFLGPDDPQATRIEDDREYHRHQIVLSDEVFDDAQGLVNGTLYTYRPYYWIDGAWTPGPVATATPAANYYRDNPDVLDIVRSRLAQGLREEVAAGRLRHEQDQIPVLNAPPQFEDTRFPVVSVHLQHDAPDTRGIGEYIDLFDDAEQSEMEGWVSRVAVDVMAWSLNPDERIALRAAIKRIVLANAGVFEALGIQQIDFSQADSEDLQSYPAPVYISQGSFSCIAPFAVNAAHYDVIADTEVTVSVEPPLNG